MIEFLNMVKTKQPQIHKMSFLSLFFLTSYVLVTIPAFAEPLIVDSNFEVEKFVDGLFLPTSMEFVGEDILILQKNDGKIFLIREGIIQPEPVLDVKVSNIGERGLLGIVHHDSMVYVYFTESDRDGGESFGNKIYKYEWDGKILKNPILVKELPGGPASFHNGGKMVVGLDGMIYAIIGDNDKDGPLQNYDSGKLDDTSVVLLVNYDESIVKPSLSENPLDHYYAIGMRNSFGLAIDPVTGNLWDSENGPASFDEVNLVEPKFNSGWEKIQGPSTENQRERLPNLGDFEYSDPEFSWNYAVAPTGLTFVDSKYFPNYYNSLLVGSFNFGTIFEFKLDKDRTGFVFTESSLDDKVADIDEDQRELFFGIDFGGITDIKVGPDGFIYVVSITDGAIYKIIPAKDSKKISQQISTPQCSESPKPFINWSGCTFDSKNLENADLRFANLTNTNLFGANLKNSDLNYAILHNADLSKTDLENSNLVNAELQNALLVEANLKDADMRAAKLINANLENSNLFNTNFAKSDLTNARLIDTNLNQTDFRTAHLEGADFSGAIFYNTLIENCFGNKFMYKILWFMFNEAHHTDFFLIKPVEWIAPHLCGPHYHMEPFEEPFNINIFEEIGKSLN